MTIFAIFVFSSLFLVVIAQETVRYCHSVKPPKNLIKVVNCSLTCSTTFTPTMSQPDTEERSLCRENSTLAITCRNHAECRHYHAGALCSRRIACLCEGDVSNQMYYISDASLTIPTIDACTVPVRWINLDSPVVPFPWKTLLVAFGILASFVVCLIAVKWLSPIIRAMQAKSSARNRPPGYGEEAGPSYSAVPLQDQRLLSTLLAYNRLERIWPSPSANRQPHISRRRLASHRTFLIAKNAMTADSPPPYDVAIQRPPTYDEIEEQPLNGEPSTETRISLDRDMFLAHSTSNASITTV